MAKKKKKRAKKDPAKQKSFKDALEKRRQLKRKRLGQPPNGSEDSEEDLQVELPTPMASLKKKKKRRRRTGLA